MSDLDRAVDARIDAYLPGTLPPFQVLKVRGARRERRQRGRAAGAVALSAVAVAAIVLVPSLTAQPEAGGPAAEDAPVPGVQRYEGLTREHVTEPVRYPQTPPVGGDHAPVWQDCGVYTDPVADENAVHSMEHGAVWVTYRPELPAGDAQALRRLVDGQAYVLLSPNPRQDAAVSAQAWGLQLSLADPADPRLARFVDLYANGPQAPEKDAPCTGGTSATTADAS